MKNFTHRFKRFSRQRAAQQLYLAIAGLAGLASFNVQAHDFWIQPRSFLVPEGSMLPFTLQVGHGPERNRSLIPLQRITHFGSVTPLGQMLDLRRALNRSQDDRDGQHHLQVPGIHVLYLVTDNRAQSHLPAPRFNAYLREEGLLPALAQRRAANWMDRDGAERYSRVAKTLIQVGPAGKGGQDIAGRKLGLPLEIVLERSPFLRPNTSRLPIHVIYEGKPLSGAQVKLTNMDKDAEPLEIQRTDAAGNAIFTMPPSGSWRLNVVWTKPVKALDGIDYETIFSSLAFGLAE